MTKIKSILYILGLPFLYMWIIATSGLSLFRDNGGHTSGLCSGFLVLGLIVAIVVGIIEIGVIATVLYFVL